MRTKMRIKGYRAGRIPSNTFSLEKKTKPLQGLRGRGQSPTVLKETGSKGKISE